MWPGDPSIPRDSLNTDYGPKHYAMIADEIDIDNPLLFIVGELTEIFTRKNMLLLQSPAVYTTP